MVQGCEFFSSGGITKRKWPREIMQWEWASNKHHQDSTAQGWNLSKQQTEKWQRRANSWSKRDSPNNFNVTRARLDANPIRSNKADPQSSNKADFTRARLDVKTESPIDAKITRASFRLDNKVTRASFRLDYKVTTRRNNRKVWRKDRKSKQHSRCKGNVWWHAKEFKQSQLYKGRVRCEDWKSKGRQRYNCKVWRQVAVAGSCVVVVVWLCGCGRWL